MTAGTGTALYPAPPERPAPPSTYGEQMIRLMRSPAVEFSPQEHLTGLLSCGVLTANEARVAMETWYEYHSMPSFYVSPPEL